MPVEKETAADGTGATPSPIFDREEGNTDPGISALPPAFASMESERPPRRRRQNPTPPEPAES